MASSPAIRHRGAVPSRGSRVDLARRGKAGPRGRLPSGALPAPGSSVVELAREGPHSVGLVPAVGGGWLYVLRYSQAVTGCEVARCQSAKLADVLAALWAGECRHAEPLGLPDDPRFGLHLHRLLGCGAYPSDVSRLSASAVSRLPAPVEWR